MKNKVLIVGLGQIGLQYDLHLAQDSFTYTHSRAFSKHKDFDLIAAVDNNKKQRDEFSQKYSLPAYDDRAATIHLQGVINSPIFKGYKILDPEHKVIMSNMQHSQLNVVNQLSDCISGSGKVSNLCSGEEALFEESFFSTGLDVQYDFLNYYKGI